MTVTEQIKELIPPAQNQRSGADASAEKIPQSFNVKLKRGSLTIQEHEDITRVLGVIFTRQFILENGDIV